MQVLRILKWISKILLQFVPSENLALTYDFLKPPAYSGIKKIKHARMTKLLQSFGFVSLNKALVPSLILLAFLHSFITSSL